MTVLRNLALALVGLTLTLTVQAADLAPGQALTVDLGDQTAVVYYTVDNGHYRLVTTIAPDDGSRTPVRQVASLGEDGAFELLTATDARPVLVVTRQGDGVRTRSGTEAAAVAAR